MVCIRYRSCPLHSLPWQRSILMSRVLLRALSTALACLLVAPACNQDGVGPPRDATLALVADVSSTGVATVVVDVTALDIPTPLAFNIPVVNGVAAGAIVPPAGGGGHGSSTPVQPPRVVEKNGDRPPRHTPRPTPPIPPPPLPT